MSSYCITPLHQVQVSEKHAICYHYVGPEHQADIPGRKIQIVSLSAKSFPKQNRQIAASGRMRRLAAPFHGFRPKCCCVNFPIIHPHLHNLFISQGFSHFPHDFPHCYVNSIFFKKCGICVGGRGRAAPVQRVPPHCPCSPTSIKITP